MQAMLDRMGDPYGLLGMLTMLPLLEAVNALICFAQACNVFIYDFIAALERCHGHLFILYQSEDTRFRRNDFYTFNMLLALNHKSIPMKWDTNLNLSNKVLAFVFGDH